MTQELLAWDAHAATWQPVRNECPIPHRRAQVSSGIPVPVTARVVWERDGVEEIDTVVWAWTSRSVLVELHDVRRQTIGLWLPARDVRRRQCPGWDPHTQGATTAPPAPAAPLAS